jgi:hypothetical protein
MCFGWNHIGLLYFCGTSSFAAGSFFESRNQHLVKKYITKRILCKLLFAKYRFYVKSERL